MASAKNRMGILAEYATDDEAKNKIAELEKSGQVETLTMNASDNARLKKLRPDLFDEMGMLKVRPLTEKQAKETGLDAASKNAGASAGVEGKPATLAEINAVDADRLATGGASDGLSVGKLAREISLQSGKDSAAGGASVAAGVEAGKSSPEIVEGYNQIIDLVDGKDDKEGKDENANEPPLVSDSEKKRIEGIVAKAEEDFNKIADPAWKKEGAMNSGFLQQYAKTHPSLLFAIFGRKYDKNGNVQNPLTFGQRAELLLSVMLGVGGMAMQGSTSPYGGAGIQVAYKGPKGWNEGQSQYFEQGISKVLGAEQDVEGAIAKANSAKDLENAIGREQFNALWNTLDRVQGNADAIEARLKGTAYEKLAPKIAELYGKEKLQSLSSDILDRQSKTAILEMDARERKALYNDLLAAKKGDLELQALQSKWTKRGVPFTTINKWVGEGVGTLNDVVSIVGGLVK